MINENWALLCEAGFWVWVFATLQFLIQAFPCRNAFHSGTSVLWGSLSLIGYSIWFLGMTMV